MNRPDRVRCRWLPVVFAAHTFATVAGVASIVPAGVGVFEGGAVGPLIAFDVPLEAALAATLLTCALTLWLPMVPGLLVMRAEAGAQRAGGRAR